MLAPVMPRAYAATAGSARALVCQAQEGAMPSSRAATTAGTLRGCRCAANAAIAPPAASRTLAACARGLADYTGCAPGVEPRTVPAGGRRTAGADAIGKCTREMTDHLYLSKELVCLPAAHKQRKRLAAPQRGAGGSRLVALALQQHRQCAHEVRLRGGPAALGQRAQALQRIRARGRRGGIPRARH